MANSQSIAIRKQTFLGGILLGSILAMILSPFGWLPSAILGALLGGSFLGAVGEGYIRGHRDDIVGAGVALGLLAGTAAALAHHPLTWWNMIIPIASIPAAVAAGTLGFAVGSIVPRARECPMEQQRPVRLNHRDFFLSYKSEDADVARQVAECLVSNGFSVWFAEYEILLPDYDVFQAAVDNGLKNCTFGLLFTNPRYWASRHCQQEAAWLRENLTSERVIDIGLTTSKSLPAIISEIRSRTGLNVDCGAVSREAAETTFSARCTEIGLSTTGFCLVSWNNASVDGSDQARFRSLDSKVPLEFNVRFDFSLQYAPGKPYTTATIPVLDDRKLYNERRVFADWWMKRMGDLSVPLSEEGLHLVWRDGRTHVALTHRIEDLWMRKYSLIINGQGLSRPTEVILTFAVKGDFRRFCAVAAMMDQIVQSVYITNESSKTTTVED